MKSSDSSVSWRDLHATITQCTASVVRESIAEIAARPECLPIEGKVSALARLAATGIDAETALALLSKSSLSQQVRERGTPAVHQWFLKNLPEGRHLRISRSTLDLSKEPTLALAPVWVDDCVEGRVVRLARVWNFSGFQIIAQWENTVGFINVAHAVSRARQAYSGQWEIVPDEVRPVGGSEPSDSPPSFWSHRNRTGMNMPDVIWARDTFVDRVEGSLWDAQERLVDDLWVRGGAIKVGITNDPSVRAKSEMYAGFTSIRVIGESDIADRISACEANLVRHIWRTYGRNHPQCLNIRAGGSEHRQGQQHYFYLAIRDA